MDDRNKKSRLLLENLARERFELDYQKDSVRISVLDNEIFLMLYELFMNKSDCIGDFFLKQYKNYKPDKGTFYEFADVRMRYLEKDLKRENADYKNHARIEIKDEDEGIHTERMQNQSYDENILNSNSGKNIIASDSVEEIIKRETEEAVNLSFIAGILNFKDNLKGRSNNPTTIHNFKRFFTERLTSTVKETNFIEAYLEQEQELMNAINLEFQDFYMSACVRKLKDIQYYPLKNMCEILQGEKENQIKLPLPAQVHIVFIEQVEGRRILKSSLSEQKNKFNQFLKETIDVEKL